MSLFESHDGGAVARMGLAWAGAVLGAITLQQVVLCLTGVYTLIQIYVLVRDKLIRQV